MDPENGRRSGCDFGLQLLLKEVSLLGEGSGGWNRIKDGVRVAFEEGDVPGDGLTELFIVISRGVGG